MLALLGALLGVAVMAWQSERQVRRALAAADSVARATAHRADSLTRVVGDRDALTARVQARADSLAGLAHAGAAAGAALQVTRAALRDSLARLATARDSVAVLVRTVAVLDTLVDSLATSRNRWAEAFAASQAAAGRLQGDITARDSLLATRERETVVLRAQIAALKRPATCSIVGIPCPSRTVVFVVGLAVGAVLTH